MPASTTNLTIPYPVGTDPVADGDNAIQALAERVDLLLSGETAAVSYATNVGTQYEGSTVWRFGKIGLLKIGLGVTGAFAADATLLTLPVGYRPYLASRGGVWLTTGSATLVPAQVSTAGVLSCGVALNNSGMVGTIVFKIAT